MGANRLQWPHQDACDAMMVTAFRQSVSRSVGESVSQSIVELVRSSEGSSGAHRPPQCHTRHTLYAVTYT